MYYIAYFKIRLLHRGVIVESRKKPSKVVPVQVRSSVWNLLPQRFKGVNKKYISTHLCIGYDSSIRPEEFEAIVLDLIGQLTNDRLLKGEIVFHHNLKSQSAVDQWYTANKDAIALAEARKISVSKDADWRMNESWEKAWTTVNKLWNGVIDQAWLNEKDERFLRKAVEEFKTKVSLGADNFLNRIAKQNEKYREKGELEKIVTVTEKDAIQHVLEEAADFLSLMTPKKSEDRAHHIFFIKEKELSHEMRFLLKTASWLGYKEKSASHLQAKFTGNVKQNDADDYTETMGEPLEESITDPGKNSTGNPFNGVDNDVTESIDQYESNEDGDSPEGSPGETPNNSSTVSLIEEDSNGELLEQIEQFEQVTQQLEQLEEQSKEKNATEGDTCNSEGGMKNMLGFVENLSDDGKDQYEVGHRTNIISFIGLNGSGTGGTMVSDEQKDVKRSEEEGEKTEVEKEKKDQPMSVFPQKEVPAEMKGIAPSDSIKQQDQKELKKVEVKPGKKEEREEETKKIQQEMKQKQPVVERNDASLSGYPGIPERVESPPIDERILRTLSHPSMIRFFQRGREGGLSPDELGEIAVSFVSGVGVRGRGHSEKTVVSSRGGGHGRSHEVLPTRKLSDVSLMSANTDAAYVQRLEQRERQKHEQERRGEVVQRGGQTSPSVKRVSLLRDTGTASPQDIQRPPSPKH